MTSTAGQIAGYLATKITGLTLGTTLFVGAEPETPVNVVTIYDTGGFSPHQTVTGDRFVRHPAIQIRVRNASFIAGEALAADIREELEKFVHTYIGTSWYLGAFESGSMTHLGRIQTNAGIAHVWTMNFMIHREE